MAESHKQFITFYEVTTEVAGHHEAEDRLGETEDSRVKALENYEADVNSFLFGTENVKATSTNSSNMKVKKKDEIVGDDSKSEKKVSDSVYSTRTVALRVLFRLIKKGQSKYAGSLDLPDSSALYYL